MENLLIVLAFVCAIVFSSDLIAQSNGENIEQTNLELEGAEIIHAIPAEVRNRSTTLSNSEITNFHQEPISAQPRHHPHHVEHQPPASTFQQQQEVKHNSYNQFSGTPNYTPAFYPHSQQAYYETNIPQELPKQHSDPIIYRSGYTSYFDPGFEVQASGNQLLNTAVTVAFSLFALSMLTQIVGKIMGSSVVTKFLKERSLQEVASQVNSERLGRYMELVSKAVKMYEGMNENTKTIKQ